MCKILFFWIDRTMIVIFYSCSSCKMQFTRAVCTEIADFNKRALLNVSDFGHSEVVLWYYSIIYI